MYDKNDLIREFEMEHARSNHYFGLMYKTLQFAVATISALVVVAFTKSEPQDSTNMFSICLTCIIPVCTYIFGILFAFNAYALAVCGKRAEELHKKIVSWDKLKASDELSTYSTKEEDPHFFATLEKYVISNRVVTLISYGVPLMFFFIVPFFSIIIGLQLFEDQMSEPFFRILAIVGFSIYVLLMIFIIICIGRNFFLGKNANGNEAVQDNECVKTDLPSTAEKENESK